MYFDDDDRHSVMATESDAHREWHRNSGVPMGTPGCPQDACHPYDDGPYDDEAEQAYLDFQAEQEAIANGTATALRRCYTCYMDLTGHMDNTVAGTAGPLRGVVRTGTTGGFDPYTTETLTCGHTLI